MQDKKDITQENTLEKIEKKADEQKREFIKKFGKFASSAPVGMFVLMTMGTSKAHAGSDGGG